MEQKFMKRVVDRYWVVLSIFYQHAYSKEAKLSVAMAEYPYIQRRTTNDSERLLLANRLKRLQAEVQLIRKRRDMITSRWADADLPSVAVVGYTNAGKTSLIRALTGDASLEGRDQLFATLDVTAHGLRFPCGFKGVLIDTVGFIQDLPTHLIASFNATLQDAVHADLILHIRDLSHSDYLLHHATVMRSLLAIDVLSTTPIITVDNKIDLVKHPPASLKIATDVENCLSFLDKKLWSGRNITEDAEIPTNEFSNLLSNKRKLFDHRKTAQFFADCYSSVPSFPVSSKTNQGLLTLMKALELHLLRITNRKLYRMILPTGGLHIQHLRKYVQFASEKVLEDNPEKTEVTCVLTENQWKQFKASVRALGTSYS